jgi:hypothetical protein
MDGVPNNIGCRGNILEVARTIDSAPHNANKYSSLCHGFLLDKFLSSAHKSRVRGTRCARRRNPVPNYEIVYLNDDGKLAFKFATKCDDEKRAKILAHAMKEREHKRLEIWEDTSLVYCRPTKPL